MTNRERVRLSLDHHRPDRIPYQVDFTQKAAANMARFDPGYRARVNNCFCLLDVSPPSAGRALDANVWEDEFGVQWDRSVDRDIGVVRNCLVTPDRLAGYRLPNADDPARFAAYAEALGRHPDQFAMATIGFSLFERAWTLAGMESLLMNMVGNPGFVHDLLDRILRFNLKLIDHACDHAIDAVWFGDDWGQQSGMLMGPKLWREFIKPRLREMYQAVKARGKRVVIHCCGKVDEVLPDLIEIGVDLFNPFQPEVMDVYALKRQYGDRLAFWGGISTQQTLPYGTVQDVKDEVRRLLEWIGDNGGYVAAPAHSIPGDARPENIAAMLEVLNGQ